MTRRPRAAFVGSLSVALLLAASSFGDEVGGEAPDVEALREERAQVVARYHVRKLTEKRFTAAVEYLAENQYALARAKLESMNFGRLNAYEKALAYRLLAYAAFGQEDTRDAADYFEKAAEQQSLPFDDEARVRFSIAQLYAGLGEWRQAIQALELWFPYVAKPNPLAYYLLAISHFQLEEYEEAIPPAILAIDRSPEPREGWLQLLAALYLQRDDYEQATPVLKRLVMAFPKKQYWVQLSLIYGARGDYEKSLDVQQLAYTQDLLTEDSELRRLARSYLFHQLPHPAAEVLEKGLEEGSIEANEEVLELLGNSWIAAREFGKSLEPLRRAAMLSEDGKLYLRLAQVHVQREQWKEAAQLLQKALEKGGLEDLGRAHLLLGISYYRENRPGRARSAFVRARDHESSRTEANAWLEHINRESQAS